VEEEVSERRDRSWEAVAICLLIAVAAMLLRGVFHAFEDFADGGFRNRFSTFATFATQPEVATLAVGAVLCTFLAVRTLRSQSGRTMFLAAFLGVLAVVVAAIFGVWDAITTDSPGGDWQGRAAGVCLQLAIVGVAGVGAWATRRNVHLPQFMPLPEDE
jgi:FtsH-binding integral membrane protein